MNQKSNILITSISDKIPLLHTVRSSVRLNYPNVKVFVADSDERCLASYLDTNFLKIPKLEKLSEKFIIELCSKHDVKLIIPTRDGELLFWSSIKEKLKLEGIFVLTSPLKTTRICLDKLSFSNIGPLKNCNVIPSYKEIELVEHEKFVVKERFGSGSKKLGINVDKREAIHRAKYMNEPIFQPFINGKEISVDIYCNSKGEFIGCVSRERVLVKNGESKITKVINDKKIDLIAKSLADTLHFNGPFLIQLIKNSKGYYLIECNTRFGGASTLSIKSGLDVFKWSIMEIFEPNIEINYQKTIKPIVMVRIKTDLFL